MTRITIPALAVLTLAACASQDRPAGNGGGNGRFASLSPDAARFRVEHTIAVPVPEGAKDVRIWFPLPREEAYQSMHDLNVVAPAGWKESKDANGNRLVYVQVPDPKGKVTVKTSYQLQRKEVNVDADPAKTRPLTEAEKREHAEHLRSEKHMEIDADMQKLAAQICGGEQNPLRAARLLYDWTLGNIEYWVKEPNRLKASPVGSATYCLTNKTGNCTDFHSLWTTLARAHGIPTRVKYGSLFKPSLDGQDKDASYHCWPEFWCPNLGWVPHDVAIADIYVAPIAIDATNKDRVTLTTAFGYDGQSKDWVDYYFGNLDARRVTWSLGRQLQLDPPQAAGPVNFMARGYVEVDGKEFPGIERKMTFREER